VPTLNDVLAGSQAQAVQVQQIIDALKGTPNKGVPVALVSLNDPNNYALTVQNDDPVNSRALSVLKADGTTLISADATGVTLGAPVNVPPGSISGTAIAAGSISNAMLGADVARDNQLTNGSMDVWQRGPGPYTANGAHAVDRWDILVGSGDTLSVSKDTSNQDVGSIACAAMTYTHGSGQSGLFQDLKTSDLYQLRGKTLSLSVRVKSTTASTCVLTLTGDGTGVASAVSASNSAGGYQTLTASGYVVPADATFVRIYILCSLSCTIYVDNAMLVVGSQAANYVPMHPADDLARCLRYYEKQGVDGSGFLHYTMNASGAGYGNDWTLPFRAIKPVSPTITVVGTWLVSNANQPTNLGADASGLRLRVTSTASGQYYANNANAGNNIVAEANP
jgi:hypothetical protein